MAHETSREGQRLDKISASDDPHDLYRQDGTPVLRSTAIGNVVEKSVISYTLSCPECDISGRYIDDDPACPNCGLILTGNSGDQTLLGDQLVRDAKAAGRVSPSDA